jgi:hypothetical protein
MGIGLTLNASKTQAMLISNYSQVSPLPDLFLGGVLFDWRDVVLNLGLTYLSFTLTYSLLCLIANVQ